MSLVLLLAALPAVMAVIVRSTASELPENFVEGMLDVMLVSAILPVVTITLATSAFGNEVEDGTLGYLVLKPPAPGSTSCFRRCWPPWWWRDRSWS